MLISRHSPNMLSILITETSSRWKKNKYIHVVAVAIILPDPLPSKHQQSKKAVKGTHQVVTTRLEFPLGQRPTVRGRP